MLGSFGWGTESKSLKYKTAHNQKVLSMNRGHLKIFDQSKPSKFNGGAAGFNEKASDRPIIDMNPEVFNINFPSDSKI